jgi:hypothetical protein
MTTPSPADCIGQYIKLRNYIAAKQKAFDEELAPYQAAMTAIENVMLGELNKIGTGEGDKASIATPQGTCFRKRLLSVKVADREEFMDFLFDGRREGFITNAVSKEAVTEYMDQFKSTPPGIDTQWIHKIQFNSPKG